MYVSGDSGCTKKYSVQSYEVGFAFLAPSQRQQTLRCPQIMCPNIPHCRLKIKLASKHDIAAVFLFCFGVYFA